MFPDCSFHLNIVIINSSKSPETILITFLNDFCLLARHHHPLEIPIFSQNTVDKCLLARNVQKSSHMLAVLLTHLQLWTYADSIF